MRIPTTQRRIATTLVAATVALISAFAAAGAHADQDPGGDRAGEDETITTAGGKIHFSHHGEIVTASDTREDGLGVRAYLVEAGTFYVTDRSGDDGDPARLNASVPEGQKVLIKMCYIDQYGDQAGCSDFQAAIA